MHRFFTTKDQILEDEITILGDDAHHIGKVLRLAIGDEIIVCDGDSTDYLCVILSISKSAVSCKVVSKEKKNTEPSVKVTLFQGLPKGSKMEYIIQKCVEMGIFKISPCKTSRCVVKLKNNDEKSGRWQKIADEAAKQCGRGILPTISDAVSFDEMVKALNSFDLVLFAYEDEKQSLLSLNAEKIKQAKSIAIIIGPEGGFELAEAQSIKEAGAISISLGKRILRTETAGLVALTAVMYSSDEF